MIDIERTSYGFRLTLAGKVTIEQATQMKVEVAALVATFKPPFGIVADTREVIPLAPAVKNLFLEAELIAKEAGLDRSAVVIQSPVVKSQAEQLSFLSQINSTQRIINAFTTVNWEEVALAWVVDGIEPSRAHQESNQGDKAAPIPRS